MAFAFVQATSGGTGLSATGSQFSINWTTGSGNALFAGVFVSTNGTVNPPASQGWTVLAAAQLSSTIFLSTFYNPNAPALSGTQTWTFTSGGNPVSCLGGGVFAEFSGGAASGLLVGSPVVQTGTTAASPAIVPTGSLTDSDASDLLLCFGCCRSIGGAYNFTSRTGGFTIPTGGQISQGNGSIGGQVAGFLSYLILTSSGGPYSPTTTVTTPGGNYATVLSAFAPGATDLTNMWLPSQPDLLFDRNEIVAY